MLYFSLILFFSGILFLHKPVIIWLYPQLAHSYILVSEQYEFHLPSIWLHQYLLFNETSIIWRWILQACVHYYQMEPGWKISVLQLNPRMMAEAGKVVWRHSQNRLLWRHLYCHRSPRFLFFLLWDVSGVSEFCKVPMVVRMYFISHHLVPNISVASKI